MTTPLLRDVGCGWPGCGETDVLVSFDGGRTAWCFRHGDDSELPDLVTDRMGECVACGEGSMWRLPDGPWLHPVCRRQWVARQVSRSPRGAYARRRSTRA